MLTSSTFPSADRLLDLAAADGWKPEGYAALLLARPRLWSQPGDGFAQFARLVRALPLARSDT